MFLLLCIWAVVLLFERGAGLVHHELWTGVYGTAKAWLLHHGVSSQRVLWGAGTLSGLLVLWLYLGFEKLIVTPEAITRRLPLGPRRSFRWSQLDEVLIEHIESRFEGKRSAKKILTLYATRPRFLPFRRRMKITNREFDCYHHVERLASQISIPAIAARKRQEIEEDGRIALFAMRESGDGVLAILCTVIGVTLLPLWGLDSFWAGASYPETRPYVLAAGCILLLIGLKKFFFRQLGVDRDYIYIMRREWVMRKIPIETIVDVRVLDNRMRILARVGKNRKERQVFKTSRFIRNRGVLLRLIRDMYDARRLENATPIVPLSSSALPTPEEVSKANGPVRVIEPDPHVA